MGHVRHGHRFQQSARPRPRHPRHGGFVSAARDRGWLAHLASWRYRGGGRGGGGGGAQRVRAHQHGHRRRRVRSFIRRRDQEGDRRAGRRVESASLDVRSPALAGPRRHRDRALHRRALRRRARRRGGVGGRGDALRRRQAHPVGHPAARHRARGVGPAHLPRHRRALEASGASAARRGRNVHAGATREPSPPRWRAQAQPRARGDVQTARSTRRQGGVLHGARGGRHRRGGGGARRGLDAR